MPLDGCPLMFLPLPSTRCNFPPTAGTNRRAVERCCDDVPRAQPLGRPARKQAAMPATPPPARAELRGVISDAEAPTRCSKHIMIITNHSINGGWSRAASHSREAASEPRVFGRVVPTQ